VGVAGRREAGGGAGKREAIAAPQLARGSSGWEQFETAESTLASPVALWETP